MKKTFLFLLLFTCFILIFKIKESHALEPFDNIPLPSGLYFLHYPIYYTADKLTDKNGNVSTDHLGLRSYKNVFRLTYYNKTASEKTWAITSLLPVGRIELLDDHDTGFGDLTIATAFWLVDDKISKTWFAPVLFIDAPTGQYDNNKVANMGSNVWRVRPTFIFAKLISKLDIELTHKYNIYTRNRETNTRQGNENIFESYIGYFIKPNILLGAHFNAMFGDDITESGQTVADSGARVYQTGPSINWMIGDNFGFNFENLYDFNNRNAPEGKLYLVRLFWKIY